MEIIPVIDLMQGQVVHARMGKRQHYQAISSQLCPSSEPVAVLQALLGLYPFSTVYIADLDAIQGIGSHQNVINKLAVLFPGIQFWLDAGIRNDAFTLDAYEKNIRFIIGSENMTDIASYEAIHKKFTAKLILSLDYKGAQRLGPAQLNEDPHYWPDTVIGMQLSQVGSELGPASNLMHALQTLNQSRTSPSKLFAAGGIRHIADCELLRLENMAGALIATALHNGAINRQDLNTFYRQ